MSANGQETVTVYDMIPPQNVATIDQSGKTGNTYNKEQLDDKLIARESLGYIGEKSPGTITQTGSFFFKVISAGNYVVNGTTITVTAADITDNLEVQILVTDGVPRKKVVTKPELILDENEVPSGYSVGSYNTVLSTGYYYFDTRCLVEDKSLLSAINIPTQAAGDIELIALRISDKSILLSEPKTLIAGSNKVNFSDLTTINESFYVCIKAVTTAPLTNFPPDGEGFSYMKGETGVFEHSNYRLGYSIVLGENISQKIQSIEILTASATTNLQNTLNKNRKVALGDKIFEVEDTITIPSGTTIDGFFGKSRIKAKSGFVGDILKIENAEDISISNIVIEGNKPNYGYSMNGIDAGANIINTVDEAVTGLYRTNENGLVINSSERLVLDSLIVRNLGGIGVKANKVGKDYTRGMKASKLFIKDCYTGLHGENEHEFSNYSELMVTLCQIGQYFESGNLMTANSIFTRCRVGILVNDGYNNAHGTSGLLEVKHHQIAGIAFKNVTNGHYLPSLHLDYAHVIIDNSKGVVINGHFGHNCNLYGIGNNGGKNVVNITSITGVADYTPGSNVEFTQKVVG